MKKYLLTLAALLTVATAMASHYVIFNPSETPPSNISENEYFVTTTLLKDNVRISLDGHPSGATDQYYFNSNGWLKVYLNDSDQRLMSVEFFCEGYFVTDYWYNGSERGLTTWENQYTIWQDGYTTDDGTFYPYTDEDYQNGNVAGNGDYFGTDNGVRHVNFSVPPVDIHFTEIRVKVYDPNEVPPVEPTEKTGAPVFNGYTTDGIHAYFVEIQESEPSTIYFRVQYGQNGEFTEWAEYEDILNFTQDGWYRIEAYAVANGKLPSDPIAYEFVVSPSTGIDEMMSSKQVASTRYFNIAGQEMQQANGMTIVVTTYTDGTTNATKVMK